ncbi:MAG: hypothetical protein ACK5L3_12705, partial [Oscillospiraceae bacterium]
PAAAGSAPAGAGPKLPAWFLSFGEKCRYKPLYHQDIEKECKNIYHIPHSFYTIMAQKSIIKP